jgi:hypothetical protein
MFKIYMTLLKTNYHIFHQNMLPKVYINKVVIILFTKQITELPGTYFLKKRIIVF